MTHNDFLQFNRHMGYTHATGAAAFGLVKGTYGDYARGVRHASGAPVVYDNITALACTALVAGLEPHADIVDVDRRTALAFSAALAGLRPYGEK